MFVGGAFMRAIRVHVHSHNDYVVQALQQSYAHCSTEVRIESLSLCQKSCFYEKDFLDLLQAVIAAIIASDRYMCYVVRRRSLKSN
jgi:hypothetical protein